MVEAEVVAGTEGQAPFAVRSDAPADVNGYLDALTARAFYLVHVAFDVGGAVNAAGTDDAAVFNEQQFLVWEHLRVVLEHAI